MNKFMKDKTILLGVTGGIAAYKAAELTSLLVKSGAKVHVIMTKNGLNFIHPITFETITGNKCLVDTFDRDFEFKVEHVSLAKQADVFVIAPATANTIAKIAHGMADDMLTTTFLAATCKKIVAPAMNTNMYLNTITQENIQKLETHHIKIISPELGNLACGDTGIGKLPAPLDIFQYIEQAAGTSKDLEGKQVLITAGATQEAIDPVRYITNHSTGKMGYSLAKICKMRGAEVILVSGMVQIKPPVGVKIINVKSAQDMYDAVISRAHSMDIIIKAAAVADYTPIEIADEKIKKSDLNFSIPVKRTKDILMELGSHKTEKQILCGFSMETENMIEHSKEKLKNKNLDLIVANNLKQAGAGFASDTNIVTLITKEQVKQLELMSKDEVADCIIDALLYQL